MGAHDDLVVQRPVTGPALRAARDLPAADLSRRGLLRRAVGAGLGLWLMEMTAGTLGFLWSADVRPIGPTGR